MLVLYLVLNVVSWIVYAGFVIWLCVEAFRVKPWWPVVILLSCGLGSIVFSFLHRDRARNPLRYAFTGFLMLRLGCWLIPRESLERDAMAMFNSLTNQLTLDMTNVVVEVTPSEQIAGLNAGPETPPSAPQRNGGRRGPAATPVPVEAPATRPADAPTGGGGAVITFDPPPVAKPSMTLNKVDLKVGETSSMIDFELTNGAARELKEVKLTVTYLDVAGKRLGTWSTLRKLSPVIAAQGKGSFSELAMKVPVQASRATASITEARFSDGTSIEY